MSQSPSADNEALAASAERRVAKFREDFRRLVGEVQKVIVGQDEIIEGVLTCVLGGGHGLLEGVPGLGKTKLVATLAGAMHLSFARMQFTPDLMPADIVGTNIIVEDPGGGKRFEFQRGPIFANVVLADEINRATPKTQSALLEAMQEGSVTVAKTTYQIDKPFFVLATQNPLEMEGTYPLPEAQLDRFFFKLKVQFPDREQLHMILDRTTSTSDPKVAPVMDRETIFEMRALAREVLVARHVQDYGLRLLLATHPEKEGVPTITKKYVRYGASPRGGQAMQLAAKIRAVVDGRFNVSCEDLRAALKPALRHRIILNFEGEAEGIDADQVLAEIVKAVPER
ncbi:MAG TPA: MoxR family ATPase [Myxococcota bacterium]|jgi:MoxR-like ATPase|nr:MoxR family ATPase [Myxococcota bacterium]